MQVSHTIHKLLLTEDNHPEIEIVCGVEQISYSFCSDAGPGMPHISRSKNSAFERRILPCQRVVKQFKAVSGYALTYIMNVHHL